MNNAASEVAADFPAVKNKVKAGLDIIAENCAIVAESIYIILTIIFTTSST